jgi:hypothetical protein
MPPALAAVVFVSNYLHDLATAVFFVATLFAWWTRRRLPLLYPEVRPRLGRLALWSVAAILALGAVRTVFYSKMEWLPALERNQVTILAAKHLLLVGLTAWAGWAWWRMRRAGVPVE